MELLASKRAFLFGLLNAAAVPTGDFGSAPPSASTISKLKNFY